ncbi:hypothetical protein GQ600_6586 [Phytophthora cactorum]|nr:hypothetical protein GQ600_6586 [Phytophthora cactorum]
MPGYRSSDGYGNPGTEAIVDAPTTKTCTAGRFQPVWVTLFVADTATVPVCRLTGAFASKDGRLEIVRRVRNLCVYE